MLTGLVIFGVTYLLVSARRLGWLPIGRAGAALLGATATVAFRVLAPAEALAAIDGHTIVLLFGMLAMGAFLDSDGFFDRAAEHMIARVKHGTGLLAAVVWGAGVSSALLTNDAVCVFAAPLLVRIVEKYRLRPAPYLLALALSANTGSVATLVGNPQNMLCGHLGALHYREYVLAMAPVAIASLALVHAALRWIFRADLAVDLTESTRSKLLTRQSGLTLAVILLTAVLYLAGTDLAWTAAGGAALLLILVRRPGEEIWARVDWSVLLFFAGLFVVVEGLVRSGATAWFFSHFPLSKGTGLAALAKSAFVFLLGSNLVSNVPFILVVRDQMAGLQNPKLAWELLAMASTFAGNLTLIGSVANVIVAESARRLGGIGFWAHLRVGLPLALGTTALGTLWLAWLR